MNIVVYHGLNRARNRKTVVERWLRSHYKCETIEHYGEAPHEDWAALRKALSRVTELDGLLVIPRMGTVGKSPVALPLLHGIKFRVIDRGEELNMENLEAKIVEIGEKVAGMGQKIKRTMQMRSDRGLRNGPVKPPTKKHLRKNWTGWHQEEC